MKVIDINTNEPHKASEVICVKCGKRWFAVRHVDTWLKELHCEQCGPGFVIETGEEMRDRSEETRPNPPEGMERIKSLLKFDPLI
jgi:ribosomal protein S27AE